MRIKQCAGVGLIFAALVLTGNFPAWAQKQTPSLEVTVRNQNGEEVPLAGQVQMTDAVDPNNDVVRTPRGNDQGHAVFGPDSFMGLTLLGDTGDAEPQSVLYDGKVSLHQGYFKVNLVLNAEGYVSQSEIINVPAQESVSYTFVVE